MQKSTDYNSTKQLIYFILAAAESKQ